MLQWKRKGNASTGNTYNAYPSKSTFLNSTCIFKGGQGLTIFNLGFLGVDQR